MVGKIEHTDEYDYVLVKELLPSALSERVTELLNKGYDLVGRSYEAGHYYHQTLIKRPAGSSK